jgi:alpha-L-rhamnosidase
MNNILSVFTDCPGREKLSYPADYTMVMGALYRNFNFDAFMRTTMHTLVEGQSVADTYMRSNVALKTPVYDWGYTRRFRDEINWGNAIVLVPSLIHELQGDSSVIETNYDKMVDFVEYVELKKLGTTLFWPNSQIGLRLTSEHPAILQAHEAISLRLERWLRQRTSRGMQKTSLAILP